MQSTTVKKSKFDFITRRPFWVNLLAALFIMFLLIFLFLQMLSWITNHGKFLTVPSVVGMKTTDAIKLLEGKGFEVAIQDSTYTDTAGRGTVLKQLPDPDATVKVNRTVFLTVNRLTLPMVDMPKLEGQSLRFAMDMLARHHLQLGDTIYRPDFMMGSVLEQQYNGARIPEKTKVLWGSKITLIIGGGLDKEQILVPSVLGMTYEEGKAMLEGMGISIGAVVPTERLTDTAHAFIIRQSPDRFDEDHRPRYMQAGQVMDLYLSPVNVIPKDSINNDLNLLP